MERPMDPGTSSGFIDTITETFLSLNYRNSFIIGLIILIICGATLLVSYISQKIQNKKKTKSKNIAY